jgi:hypothetical protein
MFMKSLTHLSLTKKLALAIVVTGLIPAVIIGFLANHMAGDISNSYEDVARNIGEKIDRNLFERYSDVQAFGVNDAVNNTNSWYQVGSEKNRIAGAANNYAKRYGIVVQIKSLDEVIVEIAAASKEQSVGVSEVNMAVTQMYKVAQSNAAAAEENAASASERSSQSSNLQEIVTELNTVVTGMSARSRVARPGATRPAAKSKAAFKVAKPAAHNTPLTLAASAPAPVADGFDIPMPDIGGESPTGTFKNF